MSEERNDVIKYVRGVSRGPLLVAKKLSCPALHGVNFSLFPGETLAVIGECGGGRSALAETLSHRSLGDKPSGELTVDGQAVATMTASAFNRAIQVVDHSGRINPKKAAWQVVADPLALCPPQGGSMSPAKRKQAAVQMMTKLGLASDCASHPVATLSREQQQLTLLARALILNPRILVWDAASSALGPSSQATVLNHLLDLQQRERLSLIYMSHNLSVVHHISDRVMVMFQGAVVEYGSRNEVFAHPQHPYTKSLLACEAQPSGDSAPSRTSPQPSSQPSPQPSPQPNHGCAYLRRCPLAIPECEREIPVLRATKHGDAACIRA